MLVGCIWPALVNGGPFFYLDTVVDIRGVEAGLSRLLHRPTVWSGDPSTASAGVSSVPAGRSLKEEAVPAGRSIYYGGPLYIGAAWGDFWLVALGQAALLVLAIALTLHSARLFTWGGLTVVVMVLAAVTPMPFYVSFLMPDIFAALTILACANLWAYGDKMRRSILVFWLALLSASVMFHMANSLIALLMFVALITGHLVFRLAVPWRTVVCVLTPFVIALAGGAFFFLAVTELVGKPPILPPFLMARMIADGPGYRYLQATCPQSQLEVCHFVQRLPTFSSVFLFSSSPSEGVFQVADPETRRKLSDEQFTFFKETFLYDPMGVLLSFGGDAVNQIGMIGLTDFNYSAGAHAYFELHVPEPYRQALKTTRAWKADFPTNSTALMTVISAVLSFLYAVWLFARKRRNLELPALLFLLAIILGVVVNAMVCGCLSVPHDRYQARVIWLLPLAAMVSAQLFRRPLLKSRVIVASGNPVDGAHT